MSEWSPSLPHSLLREGNGWLVAVVWSGVPQVESPINISIDRLCCACLAAVV